MASVPPPEPQSARHPSPRSVAPVRARSRRAAPIVLGLVALGASACGSHAARAAAQALGTAGSTTVTATTVPPTSLASTSTTAAAPSTTAAPATTASPSTTTAVTSAPAPSTTASTRCRTAVLHVALHSGGVASGHVLLVYTFTNAGTSTCTVEGYPALQLQNATGGGIPTAVSTGGGYIVPGQTPTLVSVAPGAPFSFGMQYADIPTGSQSCPMAATVRITLPQAATSVSVAGPLMACGGALVEGPLMAGATVTG